MLILILPFCSICSYDIYSDPIFSNSFDFENGTHTIEFTLYSSDTGLPIWEPLVQTSIEFVVESADVLIQVQETITY